MRSRDLNSGLHSCIVNDLLTESSPWFYSFFKRTSLLFIAVFDLVYISTNGDKSFYFSKFLHIFPFPYIYSKDCEKAFGL